MIIELKQTASNIKQLFDVRYDENTYCSGQSGSYHKYENITLSKRDRVILTGDFVLSNWKNYIPYRFLFGFSCKTRNVLIKDQSNTIGCMYHNSTGYFKHRYVISLSDGKCFDCYYCMKERFDYVSIYEGETQIGLIETYLTVDDYKYRHKLYVLDDYSEYRDILTLFVIYYSNYTFSKRFHMTIGTHVGYGKTYSHYNRKYDPEWRENHFPEENYWGQIHI